MVAELHGKDRSHWPKGGLTVEQATGMVGKRAQASILILKDSTEEIKNLTQEYVESFGEAATVAAKQLDTVRGQFTLTKSAWKALSFLSRMGREGMVLVPKIIDRI